MTLKSENMSRSGYGVRRLKSVDVGEYFSHMRPEHRDRRHGQRLRRCSLRSEGLRRIGRM